MFMTRGVICEYCPFSFTLIANKPTTISCSAAALSSCNDANLVLEVPLAFTDACGPSATFAHHERCGVDKARFGVAGDVASSRASAKFRSPCPCSFPLSPLTSRGASITSPSSIPALRQQPTSTIVFFFSNLNHGSLRTRRRRVFKSRVDIE